MWLSVRRSYDAAGGCATLSQARPVEGKHQMVDRPTDGPEQTTRRGSADELPAPEVADFIRFAYRRRRVGWPEIYDDMCAVASRREFRGWDHARLAEAGVTFSLLETPRLAAWVRAVLPRMTRPGATSQDAPGDSAAEAAVAPREVAATRRGSAR